MGIIPVGSGHGGCPWMSDPGVVRAGADSGLDSKTSMRAVAGDGFNQPSKKGN